MKNWLWLLLIAFFMGPCNNETGDVPPPKDDSLKPTQTAPQQPASDSVSVDSITLKS